MPLTVGALGARDIDVAFALSSGEGWNQTVSDWTRLTRLEPAGCFAVRDDGHVVGAVTVTTYGSALAWIGMMVVHADYRRRGIGAALMQQALDYARDCGVAAVKLDATPAGRPLYESLGFTGEAELHRWQGLAQGVTGVHSHLESNDVAVIHPLDAAAYGADRSRLLQALLGDGVASPLIAWSRERHPVAYALARRGREAFYVGPLVATHASAAADLLHAMLARLAGAEVCLDHLVGSHLPASALEQRGLTRRRTLLRMRLGPRQTSGTPPSICASAGPELG